MRMGKIIFRFKKRGGKKMINFTVGPVQSSEEIREIGYQQVPYFRTPEFSEIMLENERLIKKFAGAEEDARVAFITGSGTASMEASIINFFNEDDKVLVVNGGGFGQRFADICKIHGITYTEIKLDFGKAVTKEILEEYDGQNYTGFIVNIHETSSGQLYDIELISEFCRKNNLFLLVDAISSFLADEIDMQRQNIGAMITSSQKALACPPGISIIVLSKEAINRIERIESKCMYLDLKEALKNGERGQTPFTPAVGILLQINARLKQIDKNGGQQVEINKTKELAEYFRSNIKEFPFDVVPDSQSNAVTTLYTSKGNAKEIFAKLKDEYQIWICPNGGTQADSVFRIGHIGSLNKSDYDILLNALKDLQKRGII